MVSLNTTGFLVLRGGRGPLGEDARISFGAKLWSVPYAIEC